MPSTSQLYGYSFVRSKGIGMTFDDGLFINPLLGKLVRVAFGNTTRNRLCIGDAARKLLTLSKLSTTKTKVFTAPNDIRSFAEIAAYIKSLIPGADTTLLLEAFVTARKSETTSIREEIGWQLEWIIEEALKKSFTIYRSTVKHK
jgi:hypothetical protein